MGQIDGARQPDDRAADDDAALVAAAQRGDQRAFAELVRRYEPGLRRYLYGRTGDPDRAADLAQEAFLDAFRHLDRLGAGRPFAPWLYRIAQYELSSDERRRRRAVTLPLDRLSEDVGATAPTAPSDALSAAVERDAIRAVLAALPPRHREALLLRHLEGLTAAEVGALLGISEAAARRRIARADEAFRQRYNALVHPPRADAPPPASDDDDEGSQPPAG
jgi:RNA polymerase sigma-70 factor (ECF subfamily)